MRRPIQRTENCGNMSAEALSSRAFGDGPLPNLARLQQRERRNVVNAGIVRGSEDEDAEEYFFPCCRHGIAIRRPMALAAGPGGTETQNAPMGEHASMAELSAFQNVKIPLPQAISTGIQHVGSGKGMDVSFESKGGTPAYRTKVYHNHSVWEGLIDANNGQVIGQGTTVSESRLDREDKAELAGLNNAKTTLAEAVKTAEQHAGGKAIDAGIEERGGRVAYEIQVVKSGGIHQVSVDPATGRINAG